MKVKVQSLSCVRLFVTPWTVAHQVPLSMGSSRQEYRSGWPFPSPGGLSDPGIEPGSPASQADALPSEPPGKPVRSHLNFIVHSLFVCFLNHIVNIYKVKYVQWHQANAVSTKC